MTFFAAQINRSKPSPNLMATTRVRELLASGRGIKDAVRLRLQSQRTTNPSSSSQAAAVEAPIGPLGYLAERACAALS